MILCMLCINPTNVSDIAATVYFGIAVQNLLIEGIIWNPDFIIAVNNRCEIAYEYKSVFWSVGFTHEGKDAVVAVIAVKPFKALVAGINFIKSFFRSIKLV